MRIYYIIVKYKQRNTANTITFELEVLSPNIKKISLIVRKFLGLEKKDNFIITYCDSYRWNNEPKVLRIIDEY